MNGWRALTWAAPQNVADAFSDWLMEEMNAISVSAEDADAGTDKETPQFDEPGSEPISSLWINNQVTALFTEPADSEKIAAAAKAAFPDLSLVKETHIAPDDWVAKTQAQFSPVQISQRLWIVPSWHELSDPDAINIRLDPGMAFGTGTHPTTRLCLAWLDANDVAAKRILDYGCGSGILAIAAAKLGAGEVIGVDIDPLSVEASDANAAENQTASRFMLPNAFHAAYQNDTFDIVIANILTNPLKVLAPSLAKLLSKGGSLVLSGILEEQANDVIDAYAPYITLHKDAVEEGWVRLTGNS